MKEKAELSASESLAWQAAYDSNDAYDLLQAARSKQEQYEKISALALEGVTVTVDETVRETVSQEVAVAERGFELLKGMAHVAASMEDSPFAAGSGEAKKSKKTVVSPGPKPSARSGGKELAKTELGHDRIVVTLLERGGKLEAEDDVSAGPILRDLTGLDGADLNNTRVSMENKGLLKVTRDPEKVRFIKAFELDIQALETLAEQNQLRPNVVDALKTFQARNGQPAAEKPDFLDDKGGENNGTGSGDVDDDVAALGTGLQEELRSIRVRSLPAQPRRRPNIGDKNFGIGFEVEGRSLRRTIKVRELMKLPAMVRMLIGFGQVNTPRFDFYTTTEQRRSYVLRILNKGREEAPYQMTEADLDGLIEQAEAAGYLHQNGKGPEVTGLGIDFVRETKYGRAKLGQRSLTSSKKSAPKAGTPAPEPNLSRATLIA